METTFNQKLLSLRMSAGLKLRELAMATGIDQALLSKYENGSRVPPETHLGLLSAVYQAASRELRILWLAEKLYHLLKDEELANEAWMVAEPRMHYLNSSQATQLQELDPPTRAALTQLDDLRSELLLHQPVDATQKQKMQEYFAVQYTYESNRIEGNTLTLGETRAVVMDGITIAGKSVTEHLEAINHLEAIALLEDLVAGKTAFTERVLLQIHGLILRGIDRSNAGVYRGVEVRITGSSHVPPQPYILGKLMEDYFLFYQKHHRTLHPVLLAAEMHERLVSIHPFIDGNGRTARLVMNLILLTNGYPTCILKGDPEARLRYYRALEKVQLEGQPLSFYHLIIQALQEALQEHLALSRPG